MLTCRALGLGALALTVPLSAQGVALDWTQAAIPGQRAFHAMAYDAARQRVVMFGGRDGAGLPVADTWEWDGAEWSPRRSTAVPPTRSFAAMAYDAAKKRTVLFGGAQPNGSGPFLGDTWEWDGDAWLPRAPAMSPSPRRSHSLAYDELRQRVVLFGGWDAQGLRADTWEWDGNSWTLRTPIASPPARSDHVAAYDTQRQRMVVFGGQANTNPPHSDTWEWDGAAWTQRASAGPSGRFYSAMAYDAARQRVVLFAGFAPVVSVSYDTWEWDGSSWAQRMTTPAPPPHQGHAMAWDAARQRIVLFGGGNSVLLNADTWEWDGTTWQLRRGASWSSEVRGQVAFAYDLLRRRAVLYGGRGYLSPWTDTWEWDGFRWIEALPPISPSTRYETAMAHDFARQRMVLFGGSTPYGPPYLGDTMLFDGVTWQAAAPAASPSARAAHAMAGDVGRQRVVLFGGNSAGGTLADTWEWDGSSWLLQAPAASPPSRQGCALAYDHARGRTVLFGGNSNKLLADTWEWDGSAWLQRVTAVAPPARWRHAMAYDLTRRRVVLFGGSGSAIPPLSDTWEWDGSVWSQVVTTAAPNGAGGMVYDAVRGQMLLAGGEGSAGRSATWFFGPSLRAAAQPFGSACAGTGGAPLLTGNDAVLGGPALWLDLLNARPSSACVLGLSAGTQSLALGGGCSLYLLAPIVTLPAVTSAHGVATMSLGVPFDPVLRGGVLHAQAFVADPLGPTLGIAASAGRRLVVGD